MPKRYFKKYLPSAHSIHESRVFKAIGPVLLHHNLWHLNRRSVAGGVAVGIFTGLIPLPVQMLLAALVSLMFRVNLPVAIAATWYTNPLTALPLYYAAYRIGALALGVPVNGNPMHNVDWDFSGFGAFAGSFSHWLMSLGEPFVVGALILASTLAALSYGLVRVLWRAYIIAYWYRRKARCQARRESDS